MTPVYMYVINIALVLFLVFANAFFVVSEFSIVKIRRTKLEELAHQGNKRAKIALKINDRLNTYLSAIQLGIAKRYFVVVYEYEKGKFENYVVINPKILSESEEKIYVEEGEGCLSINRPIEGIVPRSARIKVEFYDEKGNKQVLRLREELAIVFQHEIDHLNGILFYDHIDKKNPFKDANKYRAI